MAKPKLQHTGDTPIHLQMPGWVARCKGETLEEAAFQSGAALSHLDLAARTEGVPQELWRVRLALIAAEVCVGFLVRRESAADLRDALHLLRPGDHPGPAGDVFGQLSIAVSRPISVAGLAKALPGVTPEQIALCLDTSGANPVDRAAAVVEAVLAEAPRAETPALILADAVLAKALGWAVSGSGPEIPRPAKARG